jgi:hypothetical protein
MRDLNNWLCFKKEFMIKELEKYPYYSRQEIYVFHKIEAKINRNKCKAS